MKMHLIKDALKRLRRPGGAKRFAARPGGCSSTAVVRGSRGPRAVLKFHLCVRRSGVVTENFA